MKIYVYTIALIIAGVAGASALENFLSSQSSYQSDMQKMSEKMQHQASNATGNLPIDLAARAHQQPRQR